MWTTPGVALDSNDSSTRSPMAIETGMQYIGYIGKGLSLAWAIFWFLNVSKMPCLRGVFGFCRQSVGGAVVIACGAWCGKMPNYRTMSADASPENVSRYKRLRVDGWEVQVLSGVVMSSVLSSGCVCSVASAAPSPWGNWVAMHLWLYITIVICYI